MQEFDLSGRTALVTGGNGGIGRGIALALARAGADVAIVGRNETKNDAVRAEIEAFGRRCVSWEVDVTDGDAVQWAVARTCERLGDLRVLVNNAGIHAANTPQDMTDEEWQSVIDTNLTAVFRLSRAAHPVMKRAGGGKIINIGSEYSLFGSPNGASYAASKGGVIQLTRSLAVSWARHNIQVNAIVPGWIHTDMTAPLHQADALRNHILARTPAARFGAPEELAAAAVLLAGSGSDFITGQSIAVDGGYSIA